MRSSAMRDLMAITARPEVISLAGGLPDTSTFPPATFAADMTRIAQTSAAEALQYGPTEGFEETVDCIVQVMGAEGMLPDHDDVIVTTGGQQAIDLVSKVLLDPGDVVICEAPTYPGAVPVFCSYEAEVVQIECDHDGMRIEELEATLERLDGEGRLAEIRLLGAELPEPGRGDDVAAAAAAPGRARPQPRDARRRGQPLRPAAVRRRAAAAALPARRRRLRHLHRDLLEDPLPRHPPRLGGGAAAGDGEDRPRQAGGRPLHLDPDPVLRPRVLRRRPLASSTSKAWSRSTAAGATRCSPRCAEHFPPEATWTHPEGGLFIWATLPDYIDTGDLLARALREDVAFVPGQAAYADESRGRNSMRLNFSGSDEAEIEEGVRRIGKVIAQQVELYGTLTRRAASSLPPSRRNQIWMRLGSASGGGGVGGDVLPFRKEESA